MSEPAEKKARVPVKLGYWNIRAVSCLLYMYTVLQIYLLNLKSVELDDRPLKTQIV